MSRLTTLLALVLSLALVAAACGSDADGDAASVDTSVEATAVPASTDDTTSNDEADAAAAEPTETPAEAATVVEADVADDSDETESASSYGGSSSTDDTAEAASTGVVESFTIEVWADNWMAVYVDGALIGEDSVSITTERSFNSETFTFEAAYPFTMAIEAKDYRETDSGLEYIGANNQQMGDGGIIAQVKDSSGAVVAVTSGDWDSLVVHRAPLNTDCEDDADPNSTCEYEISEYPADWTATSFDSSGWPTATVWTAADVEPKIGYDDISWDSSAQLIWGTDLEVDNTVLLRTVIGG